MNITSPGLPMARAGLILLACFQCLAPAPARAQNGEIRKFTSPGNDPNEKSYGVGAAMNERWIVVGAPVKKAPALATGVVYVYSAVTGRLARTLRAPEQGVEHVFGQSVSLCGNQVLIGAPHSNGLDPATQADAGAAYLFDLPTGRMLRRFAAADGVTGDDYGQAVALDERHVVIGAPWANGKFMPGTSSSGAVYVYSRADGALVSKIVPADAANQDHLGSSLELVGGLLVIASQSTASGALYVYRLEPVTFLKKLTGQPGDGLGYSVSISGRYLLAGAPRANDVVPKGGAAVVFDLITGLTIKRITSPAPVTDEYFGSGVALQGTLALVSAMWNSDNGDKAGAAYLVDIRTGQTLSKLTAPDATAGAWFGGQPALCGGTAILSAHFDNQAGAVYRYSMVAGPPTWTQIAAQNGAAPGVPGALHGRFGEVFIDNGGKVAFGGQLTGAGAAGGRNRGVWNMLGQGQTLDLSMGSGADLAPALPGIRASQFSRLSANDPAESIYLARLGGAGVGPASNVALFSDNGTGVEPLYRLGSANPQWGGAVLQRFSQVLQSRAHGVAVVSRMRPGTGNATATSDTGICVAAKGSKSVTVREGQAAPGGMGQFGEITRAAFQDEWLAFPAGITGGDPAQNQGLFLSIPATPGAHALIGKRGMAAPEAGGGLYRQFLGETLSLSEKILFKAALAGPGVTSGNTLGLWSNRMGSVQLEVRGGESLPGLPAGVRLRNVLRYWAVGGNRIVFLASLAGPGINTRNDTALYVHDETGARQLLMREGDPAPGCGGFRLGNLNHITVDPANGRYAVVVPLVGAPAGSNLALYTGISIGAPANHAMRRPFLTLRKGWLYDDPWLGALSLQGFSLSVAPGDGTGAGGKGFGQPINSVGTLALTLNFGGGETRVVKLPQ